MCIATKLHYEYAPTHQGVTGEGSGNNTISTKEMTQLIMKINNGEIINKESSQKMMTLMADCYDWFGVKKTIPDIKNISMKTGYYPNWNFVLTGFVTTQSDYQYAFTIHVTHPYGSPSSNIGAILKIINSYVKDGKI
jgi:hypothetical protein